MIIKIQNNDKIEECLFDSKGCKLNVPSMKLSDLFDKYNNKQFVFVEPGGNYGDYLIYEGAEKLAKQSKIKFQSVTHDEFMKSKYSDDMIIYIHGSGGFNPWWTGTPILELEKAVKYHKGIVILGPQTFVQDTSFINERVANILIDNDINKLFLFTRDYVSYKTLKECLPVNCNIYLDHDTAFHLSINDILENKPSGKYTLYSVREDKESVYFQKNGVLSLKFDPVFYCRNFDHWVYVHSMAKRIITNRTHSAILGSILGIPTTILPNSYHKNHSIWEYSLRQRGVDWLDELSLKGFASIISTINHKLFYSKLQRVLRMVYKVRYKDFILKI